MTRFVEALKRLYTGGHIAISKLDTLKANGNITQEEYGHITT